MRQLLLALAVIFAFMAVLLVLQGGNLRSLGRLVPAIGQLAAALYRDERIPSRVKISLAALLAYLASPVDLIPDFIPLLGLLDDVILVAVVLDGLLNQVDRQLVLQHWKSDEASLEIAARTARSLSRIVPVSIKRKLLGSTSQQG